ncbi:trehalose-phosphatase [Candidatus Kaiserbacteria bacterium RIFCSPHIGHO2_02_FULL_59_21]|uniref:Trehalose 6-phosphate phosphatase n=2 Tax=Candidatus Kaiseribacteriota TaxID=1752734 RepID=A0A0G1YTU3_9BACT|nr:MAG: hypothetical protein UY98_C0026G0008 [Candidatus Kaiserbacteria bacterium GW2011_GWA2_58_9]OGG62453.1 MAG: trehalose-phosphatase [Candidatus Kaiserbacteria bacterium RIFCSPHIGHO2_01_FULL_58_22]OGG67561.1 MAG: trehalose-phosphatase [Candidatus Kaiserbacteria bacterium RIFCSPHIGHO2_02_FULL_59_21]OGG80165.1 MAG: trehalose-phosphatase [Candidatus Kaiserbacteria bacterium RIFCSPLOWO2_01_FULL_59_34]OGG86956.1 MAG: trehalose-phosphatase [Candidatus Kaiserbacteria bacterium RIFCSPLOWO2_02_FULL_
MKRLFAHLDEVRARVLKSGAVVMLDFDGTLAPLKPEPRHGRMSASMRRALEKCSARFPAAVITGRALDDVRTHVRARRISVAGNHGLEWFVNGKRGIANVPRPAERALSKIRNLLRALEDRYQGVYLEDKRHSLSIHFRHARSRRHAIEREVQDAVRRAGAKHLRVMGGIFIFNVLPRAGWDKGRASKAMYVRLRTAPRSIPIFVGDDITDEDAFRALRRGITVHVKNGKKVRTAANYSVRDVEEVRKFLLWLSRL